MSIKIPDGYVLCKKGGRPKKDGRHIAVLMAQLLRIEIHKEKSYMAHEWILSHWQDRSIDDESAIRREIRLARPLMDKHLIIISENYIHAIRTPLVEGSLAWFWHVGIHEALRLKVENLTGVVQFEAPQFIPLAMLAKRTPTQR
ncbi:MAG TPA: hypothetical protein PLB25_10455 [Rhodoferax sp.]|nr:hypothetical protein [Rhodoferax sp.]